MRFMISVAMAACLATAAHAEGPGEVKGLAPFKSVELQHDGVVDIRHGAAQQVVLAAGDRWETTFQVEADGRLVIKGCKDCGARFRVTVMTPTIDALSVAEGRMIVAPGFSLQPALALKVGDGDIDAGGLPADQVSATVSGRGRIRTAPKVQLTARTTGSGEITYNGAAAVTSDTAGGGSVRRTD